jgi:hypothetical protein
VPAKRDQPSARLLRAIRGSGRDGRAPPRDGQRASEACREILRAYRAIASEGRVPGRGWRAAALAALRYLGGDADRLGETLRDYDHRRYGPFLGVSEDGVTAAEVCRAARASPKARALGAKASPLTVGVSLDAERLGGVGEVVVGPDEFSDIWSQCAGRSLITTNIGSRADIRYYLPAPVVAVPGGPAKAALESAKAGLVEKFNHFLHTPDGKPRPLVVFVEFASNRRDAERTTMLRALRRYVEAGKIAAPKVHKLGLHVVVRAGRQGRDDALRAIDLAHAAGTRHVSIDGVVRPEADRAISLPGLTDYLAPDLVADVLRNAQQKGVQVRPLNQVDPDTVARSIWSALNTARGMGLHLGKYGLFPLTLEEMDAVVGKVQGWFADWAAAPVYYVDQGIVSDKAVYVENDRAKGVATWLRAMAKHKVKVVLIDTVDKAKGWKILRTGDDSKGLLSLREVARLDDLGRRKGIKVLWAGSITGPQAYEFGALGVFGIYVTTAASKSVAVSGTYKSDPGLAAEKQPTFSGVLDVKTLLEAGYLSRRVKNGASLGNAAPGSKDFVRLSQALPAAWRQWWRATP